MSIIRKENFKPYKDLQRHEKNPFVKEPVKLKFKREKVGDEVIFNDDTSQVVGNKIINTFRKVEPDQFIKIYVNRAFLLFGLSKKAMSILIYIMHQMKPNTDKVIIDVEGDDIKMQTSYSSKSTLYGGLEELINAEIIAKGRYPDQFYINPGFMFNGKRATFIDTFERINGDDANEGAELPDGGKKELPG